MIAIPKTEVTPRNIRYDKGDYFITGAPGEDVRINSMCPDNGLVTLTWDEFLVCVRDEPTLGMGITPRVWRDTYRGMFEPPLETHKYDRKRTLAVLDLEMERLSVEGGLDG